VFNPGFRRRCDSCSSWFFICQACDRWHWYCSERCAKQARRCSQRRASRTYRQTDRGREANRKSQKKHRDKVCKEKSVSHHSYGTRPPSSTIGVKPDGQADFEYPGRKELAHDYSTVLSEGGPKDLVPHAPSEQEAAKSSQKAPAVGLASVAPPHQPQAACRVCRRVITHLVVSDVLGRSRSQRGPPCNPIKRLPTFASCFTRST